MFFLRQLVDAGRRLALEHLELEVLSGDDAIVAQYGLDGLTRQFGVVVLLAEVAQPDVADAGLDVLGDGDAAVTVAQVAGAALYAVLQVLRVRALQEHLDIVVGLDDEIVGTRDVGSHLGRDRARVGDDAEGDAAGLDLVADVLGGIVGHEEGRDAEGAQLQRLSGCDEALHVGRQLACDAIVAADAFVYVLGGIDRQVELVADASHRLDVVGVVVSDEHMMNGTQAEAKVSELLLEHAYSYSNIYQKPLCLSVEVIAITTAATAKGYEFQHYSCYFLQKYKIIHDSVALIHIYFLPLYFIKI